MQTVEKFRAELSPEQIARIEEWLEILRIVWNDGRSLLLFQRTMTRSYKDVADGKKLRLAPCCPLAVAYYRQPITETPKDLDLSRVGAYLSAKKSEDESQGFINARHSWILAKDRNGGAVGLRSGLPFTHPKVAEKKEVLIRVGQCCPLPGRDHSPPRLGYDPVGKFTLQSWFTQKHVRALVEEGLYSQDFARRFTDAPAWFVRGVCEDLSAAWSGFLKGERGEPRFKQFGEISSLSYGDAAKLSLSPAENGIDGFVRFPKLGDLQAQGFWRKWCRNSLESSKPRPLLVLKLCRDATGWNLHLTGWEMQRADYYAIALNEILSQADLQGLSPQLQRAMIVTLCGFCHLFWRELRTAKTVLTIPGEGYNAAIDDQGRNYSVLPRRHQDGVLDPHGRIAKLDEEIVSLKRAIQVQRDRLKSDRAAGITTNQGRRLAANEARLTLASAKRAKIIENNLKKMAHFTSERSQEVEIRVKSEGQKRTKKPKAKPGNGMPVEFLPNGAARVAESNRSAATVAPGKFIKLLKQEASERCQIVKILKPEAKKKPRKGK